LEKVKGNSPL